MKAIVKAHPETGAVITKGSSEKGNYGKIRVEQVIPSVENGFMTFKKRSAFITIFGDDNLAAAEQMLSAEAVYPVQGRIQRLESTTPQYEGQKAKINPETGEDHLVNGSKVYFQDVWNTDPNCEDELIKEATLASVESEEEAL